MGIWQFVEKLKTKPPTTAREFAGFPVELEWKEVGPERDERIMADGRPARAWWCEIQMLRAKEPKLQQYQVELTKQFVVMRLAKWAFSKNPLTDEIVLHIRGLPVSLNDPTLELLTNPEKYVEFEKTT